MARVKPSHIERPKKLGRCGENIHDLDYIMAKKEYVVNAPQADAVQTSQEPVIPNPLVPRPAIGTINHPMTIHRSDETVEHVLPTQRAIHITGSDGSSRYVPEWASDVRTHKHAKLKAIIEMFPSGSICKIHTCDTVAYQTVIHRIKFSTTHLEPVLHIEFFNLEDIIALLVDTSLSQYPLIHRLTIYDPGQIESIDSLEVAEMLRKLIKNEMLDIKRQIAALKDNLRQINRLRNSRDLASRLINEIDRTYRGLSGT